MNNEKYNRASNNLFLDVALSAEDHYHNYQSISHNSGLIYHAYIFTEFMRYSKCNKIYMMNKYKY
jgi:hypothetical protein